MDLCEFNVSLVYIVGSYLEKDATAQYIVIESFLYLNLLSGHWEASSCVLHCVSLL